MYSQLSFSHVGLHTAGIKKEQRKMISNLISEVGRNLESNRGHGAWPGAALDNCLSSEWGVAGSNLESFAGAPRPSLAGASLRFLSSSTTSCGLRDGVGSGESSEQEARERVGNTAQSS